jgi:hypothetical protein
MASLISPTISNFTILNKTYGDSAFNLTSPNSNSSGAFSYSSSNTNVATISGNTVSIIGAGSSTITATQAEYASNGLQFVVCNGYYYDNVNYFNIQPSEYSGIVTNISSINAGTNGYIPANGSRETYSVQWVGYFKPNETGFWRFYTSSDDSSLLWIGNNALSGNNTIGNALVDNSGLHGQRELSAQAYLIANTYYPIRIQYGEDSTDDNMIVSFSGPSTSKTTNGLGFYYNGNIYTSGTISANLTVNKATPTITNFTIPTKIYGDVPFNITAPTSNSSGAFSYSSSNTNVATISGNTITIVGAGLSTITATQAETSNYTLETITTNFTTAKANTVLSNFTVPTTRIYISPFTLTAPTSNRTGSFSYSSSDSTVARISGNEVFILKYGSTVITATQSGTSNYNENSISATLNVNLANFSICFPAGTPVLTDQGEIAIEKINPENNTIRGKKIVAITSTITIEDKIVCIEKDSLGKNIPQQKMYISRNHKVLYNKQMIKAKNLIGQVDGVYNKKYNGEILYNVLLETHEKMMVNNLIVETLDPTSIVAQLYNGSISEDEINKVIVNINDCANEYKKVYGKKR